MEGVIMDNLISIIVPVYNVEDYIKQCLDSILLQTYTNFEVIVVDDGSTDSSSEICDDFAKKDKRFNVIHKENGGVSKARNIALDNVNGSYVVFVDSDDVLPKDALKKMIDETIANKEVMYKAASTGFINATDCADYLTAKGLPFRDAYQVTGNIIQYCEETNQTLETLSLAEYKEEHALFEEDIYEAISMETCVNKRLTIGAPGKEAMEKVITLEKGYLAKNPAMTK